MEARIGRYRISMSEGGLTLKHAAGINFDMTVSETLSLLHFLKAYQESLEHLEERSQDTEPTLERIQLPLDHS